MEVNNIKKLESFNYSNVTLKKSFLNTQFKQAKEFYCNIPNDSLLYGFRKQTGKKAPGISLGGWYGADFFNNFGQFLSAFSRFYCITKDIRILEKVNYLMYEWADTMEEDGFFFYSNNPNAFHYGYDKTAQGLIDIYEFTGNEDSLKYLSKITDWAEKNLDKTNVYAHNSGSGSTEWYTIPENLYRAYMMTGEERYKRFGDSFLYNDYYKYYFENDFKNLMKAGVNSKAHRYHAYSHINALSSAAMAYYITGDSFYLKTLKNAYEIIKDTQLFNTGGYGPCETIIWPEQKIDTIYTENFHFEIACGTWAAFKLIRYLIEFTGSAFYGDWSESLIYNGVGAMLPVEENGDVQYYANYNINGASKETCNSWSCCNGTYPIDVAEYHNQIYYKNSDGICINLFIPSVVEFKKDNKKIILHQDTSFPKGNKSSVTVKLNNPTEFELSIRIPKWLSNKPEIKIGNKYIDYKEQNGWAKIKKLWKNNEIITINLNTEIRTQSLCEGLEYPKSILFGPVVLVTENDSKPDVTKDDLEKIEKKVLLNNSDNFHFNYILQKGKKLELKPFYDISKNKKYYMYFEPVPPKRIDHMQLNYGPDPSFWKVMFIGHPVIVSERNVKQKSMHHPEFGKEDNYSDGIMTNWHQDPASTKYKDSHTMFASLFKNSEKQTGSKAHISTKPGAYFELDFTGKGIRWVWSQILEGGLADIYVDNKFIETISQFGVVKGIPGAWEKNGLTHGQHSLRVINDHKKDPDSSGYTINVKHLTIF